MYQIPIPASVDWLYTAPMHEVTYDLFVMICHDEVQYQLQCGVPPERIMPVEQFVQPGDLQTFCNVVNWWPKNAPPKYACPLLRSMLHGLVRFEGEEFETFTQKLDRHKAALEPWMKVNRVNPMDPNETAEDRKKRLGREAVARHRLKHAENPDDPELADLLNRAKYEADQVTQGRKWLADIRRKAKATYEASVIQAKQARLDTVSPAEDAVAAQIQRAEDAEELVRQYKSRK